VSNKGRSHGEHAGNRLRGETSPYLLQHAGNPVNWYPWGDEAFRKAAEEDKPIFLSIGYSTCHWCHVMEHESFEDNQVARLMNETFISIKVDREERPDIDSIYMTVCQLMTGSGGWPLTVIMTPDRVPFFAATYIPRDNRFGRIGMLDLIPRIGDIWTNQREDVARTTASVMAAIEHLSQTVPGEIPGEALLAEAREGLAAGFDRTYGGFGGAPKFPSPHNLLFLLRQWKRTGDAGCLEMVEKTLQAMRRGGIYDHVGFGFHRYSTDERWVLPHFEKMLYDQALLMVAYAEAFRATGKPFYKATGEEIAAYVLRDMTSSEGGFYSAEDADSEGEEGRFYLWTEDEIREVLAEKEADLAVRLFNIEDGGNFADPATGMRPGTNVLHMTESLEEAASGLDMAPEEARAAVESARLKLFAHREQRVHPMKDDKILADWNGLMIGALAPAGSAFRKADYIESAARAADFVLTHMRDEDGRLCHTYRVGKAKIAGNLNDYAFVVHGLIELYEAAFGVDHLRAALDINRKMVECFGDPEGGGFYFTGCDDEDLLVRRKEVYDAAIPSGNSMAIYNLIRLAGITGRADLEDLARDTAGAFSSQVARAPLGHTQFLAALDFVLGPSHEVVIAGRPGARDTLALLDAVHSHFAPNKVVVFRPDGEAPAIADLAPFVRGQVAIDGKATAYVCSNHACQAPASDVERLLALLGVVGR
jgi:uncharacterized protein YyaL (SSP411 family)